MEGVPRYSRFLDDGGRDEVRQTVDKSNETSGE